MRSATSLAVRGTHSVSRGASNLAREAVEGAVRAVIEIGGETQSFVKDAVIGVVEGAAQVATVTKPAVREVVAGAMRGADEANAELGEVGRDAVEGAIVGAVSVGIDSVEASAAAVEGMVAGLVEVRADLQKVARATVGGVTSGVAATGGDVAVATRAATHTLMTHAAVADRGIAEAIEVAESTVDAALEQGQWTGVKAEDVIAAAATGAVEAAYEVGRFHGDSVRQSVLGRVLKPRLPVAPHIERRLTEIAERLSDELPRGRATWRGAAMFRAARLLLSVGGIDLAASLAYFTIFSLLPMVALVIMVVAIFSDPEVVSKKLTEILVYYFPTSGDLIHEAGDNLLKASLGFGLVAVASLVLGANGLFMAANRAVNRIFGTDGGRALYRRPSQRLL